MSVKEGKRQGWEHQRRHYFHNQENEDLPASTTPPYTATHQHGRVRARLPQPNVPWNEGVPSLQDGGQGSARKEVVAVSRQTLVMDSWRFSSPV